MRISTCKERLLATCIVSVIKCKSARDYSASTHTAYARMHVCTRCARMRGRSVRDARARLKEIPSNHYERSCLRSLYDL